MKPPEEKANACDDFGNPIRLGLSDTAGNPGKEEADINVAHLAADKAMPEWEELLGAIARGWCHPENAKKVMDEKLALAIGEEVKSFIRNLIKQQRSEVAREILEKWTTRMAEIQDDLDEIYPDNSYHPNCGGILEGITEEYLKENEE